MKKYNSYEIEVLFINGNKQIKKAKNANSYADTLKLYRQIKNKYMNKNVTINFIGRNGQNKKIFFRKQCTTIKTDTHNIKELIESINQLALELQNQYRCIGDKISYYDKQRSNIDHTCIEAINIESITDQDKIQIFDQLREIQLARRHYKILQDISQSTNDALDTVINQSNIILDKYNNIVRRNNKKLNKILKNNNSNMNTHKIIKIKYTDFKDRMRIMSNIERKYDKIIHIPEEKVLACYNKCHT